jgi:hypothetical protein
MRRGGTRSGWSAAIKTWLRSRRTKSRLLGRIPASSPTAGSGDPARSVRLGALLYLYRGGPADPLAFRGELDADQLDSLADLTEDDMHLANACLAVERDLLNDGWRAVGLLLERGMFGEEEAEARLDAALERDELGRIASEVIALMQLGLLD